MQDLKITSKFAKREWKVPERAVLRFPRLSPDFAAHFPTLFTTPFRGLAILTMPLGAET